MAGWFLVLLICVPYVVGKLAIPVDEQCAASTQLRCSNIPTTLTHGKIQESVDHTGRKMLSFKCDPGYALRGNKVITCNCSTSLWSHSFPTCVVRDCLAHYQNGSRKDGIYIIALDGNEAIPVYCDMTTDHGGWTVIQHRVDGSVNFYRDWIDYKHGFGDPDGNFWIGLDNMFHLTGPDSELYVYLKAGSQGSAIAQYSSFRVSDESDKYQLSVSGYHGTAGDAFANANLRKFSTRNSDNDVWAHNCASKYQGAWWYRDCYKCNLNGRYGQNANQGITYQPYKGDTYSLSEVEMKVRRKVA